MTVGQLIELLKGYPQDMDVLTTNDEYHYYEPELKVVKFEESYYDSNIYNLVDKESIGTPIEALYIG